MAAAGQQPARIERKFAQRRSAQFFRVRRHHASSALLHTVVRGDREERQDGRLVVLVVRVVRPHHREALLGYDLALMRAYHTHDEHNKTTILPLLTIAANDGVEEG